jgi:hypothetical protein
LFGQRQTRPHTYAHDHKVGVKSAAAFEHCASARDCGHGVLKMKNNAMLFMQRTHEVAICGPSTRSIGRSSGATM